MVSTFPTLLAFSEVSPFLIRLALGAVLIYWCVGRFRKPNKSKKDYIYSIADLILGILIIIGLWTQVAVILVGLDLIWRIIEKVRTKSFLTQGVNYYLILLVLCLSLLVTGAGWLAFDLAF